MTDDNRNGKEIWRIVSILCCDNYDICSKIQILNTNVEKIEKQCYFVFHSNSFERCELIFFAKNVAYHLASLEISLFLRAIQNVRFRRWRWHHFYTKISKKYARLNTYRKHFDTQTKQQSSKTEEIKLNQTVYFIQRVFILLEFNRFITFDRNYSLKNG